MIIVADYALVRFQLNSQNEDIKENQPVTWYPVDNLPALALAYSETICYALRRLRYQLEYRAVAYKLLPGEFTFRELRQIFEMILGESLG